VLQLFAGVLFFAIGIDLQLLKLLSEGLGVMPSAGSVVKAFNPEAVIRFGSLMFSTGLRLAMPIIGSLMLLDLAFSLVSKVHAQLQLLSLSFSAKMLAGLVLFAITLSACPTLFSGAAERTLEILARLLA
jgi:flagellar biosynthetic protein FliR